jgi:hypothetical protein
MIAIDTAAASRCAQAICGYRAMQFEAEVK